jgi:hypothetical protein
MIRRKFMIGTAILKRKSQRIQTGMKSIGGGG